MFIKVYERSCLVEIFVYLSMQEALPMTGSFVFRLLFFRKEQVFYMKTETDKKKSRVSAVILCGGKSTRMGKDKAGLLIGRKTFLQQIEEHVSGADEVLLSVKDRRDYPEIAARHIEDLEQDKGPLMGLCSALKECSHERVWVISCDMPLVDWDAALELEDYLMDGIDAVIPVDKTGKKYVLCAWYRKSVWKILEEQLKTGDYKVQHVLENLRVCYVAVQGITDGPGKFYNINTPEEYRKIRLNPIVSFVAYSGTGKTTFLEKLIPKLKAYGLKIAIVKHDGHRFDIDHKGKDSDRFTKAGADVTGLISSEKAVLMDNRTVAPEEFLKKIDGVDLILTEGFKHEPWPKIMLHRKGTGKPMPLQPEECLAVISDADIADCENVFQLGDVDKTADFLFQYIANIQKNEAEKV